MKKIHLIIISILVFSCTEEIDVPMNNNNSIVVQGLIENGQPAKILLSNSLNFNQPFNIGDLVELGIENADITITNSSGDSESLTQSIGYTDTYIYNYSGNNIIGEEGESYLLEIQNNDDYLWSITTIPTLLPIIKDSIKYIIRPTDEDDEDYGCYAYIRVPIEDADTIGNCWKIASKRCWDNSYTSMAGGEAGLYNDEYLNGWTTPIDMYPGIGYWSSWDEEDDDSESNSCFETIIDGCSGATDAFWSVGETFDLKFSAIDRASWDFWVSLLNNNPGNPFGSPSQAKSNINGGLGVFSGMSSQKLEGLIIPEDL